MHVKLTLAHSDVIGGMQTFAAPGTDNRTADFSAKTRFGTNFPTGREADLRCFDDE
jgi:hypothetical protein